MDDLFRRQREAILEGDAEEAVELAHEAVREGVDLSECIEQGYIAGIREVGRLWEEGEYFLPELVQGADAMKAALGILRPLLLESGNAPKKGLRIVMATVEGDIHDIGKTLVCTLMEANGLDVIDLGHDVPTERIVDTAEQEGARIIGLSALLTTTMPAQRRVIELLEKRGLADKVAVMVGGAPVNRAYAKEIGATGFAANAVDALAEAQRIAKVET